MRIVAFAIVTMNGRDGIGREKHFNKMYHSYLMKPMRNVLQVRLDIRPRIPMLLAILIRGFPVCVSRRLHIRPRRFLSAPWEGRYV